MDHAKRSGTWVAGWIFIAAIGALACSSGSPDENFAVTGLDLRKNVCRAHDSLLEGVLASRRDVNFEAAADAHERQALRRGLRAFNDRALHRLGGNGRACADCHQATDAFQLSPESASARLEALLACRKRRPHADDPLFRAIDADDFRVNGEAAHDFSNLTLNGLVRIVMPLPATMKLVDPLTGLVTEDTEVEVWRAVPSLLNVGLTGEDPAGVAWFRGEILQGGYQLDAREGNLQDQALGALRVHAEIQRDPARAKLDALAAFQNELFSSDALEAVADAIERGDEIPDPDGELSEQAAAGKLIFERACGTCHGSASLSNPRGEGIFRYGSVLAQCPRPVDGVDPATGVPFFPGYTGTPRWEFEACPPRLSRNVRLYEITRPDGEVIRAATSDPGRSLLTGFASVVPGPPPLVPPPLDDWLALDVPSLRNLSHTAPYFHNNSARDLEAVLDHYEQFFQFVAVTAPPPPAPAPPPLSTDGIHIDRPFTIEERPLLEAYLLAL